MIGTSIGHITVIEAVGRGGMGEVYRGHNTLTNMTVAIKRVAPKLRSDPNSRRRIIQEARAMAPFVKHPHIVGVSDVVESGQELFLIMEWVDGPDLRRRMQEEITPEQSVQIVVECAEALRAAHERGIVHRDIKPENIMLTSDGVVRVCDFGLASTVAVAVAGSATDSTVDANAFAPDGAGTPGYLAPETLLRGEAGPQTDIFSLGIVFYELMTGSHPFKSNTIAATHDRILHYDPKLPSRVNPKVTPVVERVILKMLEKDPQRRYRDVAALLADLKPVVPEVQQRPNRVLYLATIGVTLVLSVYLTLNLPDSIKRLVFQPPLPSDINLAVLPFRVANGAGDSALADGLTEALTANLSKLQGRPNYQVARATEVRSHGVDTPKEARQEFGSTLVLESTFQSDNDDVRVSYALIDTKTLQELRHSSTIGSTKALSRLQDQITDDVLRLLSIEVAPSRRNELQQARITNPSAELATQRGRGFLQDHGRLDSADKAIEAFQEALAADSQYAPAYSGIGEAYLNKFSVTRDRVWLEKAAGSCAQATNLDARLSIAHVCLGTIDNASGQYERAANEFRSALQLDSQNDEAMYQLAKAQENLGDVGGAETTFKAAIALQKYNWSGYATLGEFFNRQHRYKEAITQWQYAIALSGDNGQAYSSLGVVYMNAGQSDAAIRALEHAVALRPHWDSFSNLGLLYLRLQRYSEAAATLEKAVSYGEDYRVTGNLARIYRILGDTQKARKTYERAVLEGDRELGVNPRNSDVHILMARYYAYLGRKPEAFIHTEFALAMKPKDQHYLEIAAGVYDQVGEREKAVQTLEQAFKLGLPVSRLNTEIELAGLKTDPKFSSMLNINR